MKKSPLALTIVTGFAIFTMLFGAGNFMLPPKLGILAGQKTLIASLAFILTAVLLPMMGLIGIFLFEGNYNHFFYRLGRIPGSIMIAICMLIIGPGFVLPRIINLCYEMFHPSVPAMSLLVFSLLFSGVTFLMTYRPTRLIDVLGYIITPIKLTFVGSLILVGLYKGTHLTHTNLPSIELIKQSLFYGYGTLDLLGTIFFGSIILKIFKRNEQQDAPSDIKVLVRRGIAASCIGGSLLALVYIGLSFLGAYHGAGLQHLDEGQILSILSIKVMGSHGAFFGALAIMIACLATMIALSTVVAEYIHKEVMHRQVSFIASLTLVLAMTVALSLLGLTELMRLSLSTAYVLYPVLITLTACNMAYKLFRFKPVKVPVFTVLVISAFIGFGGIEFCKACIERYTNPALQDQSE
jgi:LIVCS family branched-chain amino acid:cation transporter